MTDKKINFGKFEFPKVNGLEYLLNENEKDTDYLFVNDLRDEFSIYFEKDFPKFTLPKDSEKSYCLFEYKLPKRVIKFFCPERQQKGDSTMLYFYVDIIDDGGKAYTLPGQIMLNHITRCFRFMKRKPKFIEVLEQIKLTNNYV